MISRYLKVPIGHQNPRLPPTLLAIGLPATLNLADRDKAICEPDTVLGGTAPLELARRNGDAKIPYPPPLPSFGRLRECLSPPIH